MKFSSPIIAVIAAIGFLGLPGVEVGQVAIGTANPPQLPQSRQQPQSQVQSHSRQRSQLQPQPQSHSRQQPQSLQQSHSQQLSQLQSQSQQPQQKPQPQQLPKSQPQAQQLYNGYPERTPHFHIAFSTETLEVGETVEAAIWLQGFFGPYSGVEGYQLQIAYDPLLLQPVQPEATGQLAPEIFAKKVSPIVWSNQVDGKGTIRLAESLPPQSTDGLFSGYGKAGVVQFKAIKPGEAKLSFKDSIIIKQGQPGVNIRHTASSSSVRITAAGASTSGKVAAAGGKQPQASIAADAPREAMPIGKLPAVPATSRKTAEVLQGFQDSARIIRMGWAKDAIAALTAYGVVHGQGDGGFHPQAAITRAEFIQLAVASLGLDMRQQPTPTFGDVQPGAWYYDAVETAAAYGLISGGGIADSTAAAYFRPGDAITRAELAAILANAIDKPQSAIGITSGDLPFADVAPGHWARAAVEKLYHSGLIAGKSARCYAPADSASRAEVSQIFHKLLLLKGD